MADHPYSDLPPDRFWAPAVGKRHALDIADLWQPSFDIRRADKIVTYGSCFAQHFSRALRKRDFTWLDCEPAPDNMPEDVAKSLNYRVFSARTGNIYTCSLLLQWVDWALGERTPPEIFWEQDGRIYDPFRPVIEPNGFGSVPEMLASRRSTIRAFRRSILECNVLVFTLGLTESWRDSALGVEYPLCPGTVAGEFDPACHVFENQDYPTILANLTQAIGKIRQARKGQGPRILLTVSPVPLTATMSGNHVLVATSESKSVLRAVAGQAARTTTYASYFPSYEIISAPVFRGMFFEPNMRSVNLHGVEHVMAQFFAGLSKRAPGGPVKADTAPRRAGGADSRCRGAGLRRGIAARVRAAIMRPLLILGDSHLAALQRGIDVDPGVLGGRSVQFHPLGAGSGAANPFHSVAADGTSVQTHAPGWRNLTLTADSFRAGVREGALLAVSLPLNTTRILRGQNWMHHVPWTLQHHDREFALSDKAVAAVLQADYRHALDFVLDVKAIGIEVMVIEAPRFFAHAPYLDHKRFDVCVEIDSRYRAQVRAALQQAAIPIAGQPAASIAPEGGTHADYRHESPDDFLHAGAAYGRLAMTEILALAATMDA